MTVALTDVQASWAVSALRALISERRLAGRPVAAELHALHRYLVTSADGSSQNADQSSLRHDDDLVDTAEAAEILGCSTRWVRQIRHDIGGIPCPCGAGYVFRRRDVIDYAAAKGIGAGPA